MFTDVVGSTARIVEAGDQRAHRETREHFAVLRRVLRSFDGHEVKSIGDGLMTTFASARQAALAAVAMQRAVEDEQGLADSPLKIRIGVNTGEVVEDDGDYFGAAVNVARRLCDAAEAGQTLLADVTVALLHDRAGLRLRSVGELALRGFSTPVAAYEAAADDEGSAPTALPALLQISDRMPFVGRRRELQVLEDAWRRVRGERQRLVTITGEGGMGKSSLARHFARNAVGTRRHVVHGRCDEEHPVAFGPLAPALATLAEALPADALAALPPRTLPHLSRLVPGLGVQAADAEHLEDPARVRLDLLDAVVALVTAATAQAQLLWLIDDLQWADRSTALVLRQVLTAPVALPVLIVATYREHEASGPVGGVVAELRAQSLETPLRLGGLDLDDVRHLVAATLGPERVEGDLPKSLYERTAGHPLFLRELIAEILDRESAGEIVTELTGVPEGVRPIVRHRVERLGADVREALEAGAVVGGTFEVEVVARALGWPRSRFLDALDAALVSREVVELPGSAPQSCAFSHDLVRDTLYATLPVGRRAELHGHVARALELVHREDLGAVAGLLAYHFGMAAITGAARTAAAYSAQAGDRALQRFAYEEAAEHYEVALRHNGMGDDEGLRAETLVGLGRALVGMGEAQRARQAFLDATEAARLAAAPDAFARAALGAGFGGAAVSYADTQLIELLEDAESMLAIGYDGLRAQVQARLAREVFSAGDHERADRLSTRALNSAVASGNPLDMSVALNARHQCLAGPDHLQERLEIQQRGLALAEETGHLEAILTNLLGLALDHLRLGDVRSFDASLARYDDLAAHARPSLRVGWYRATFAAMRAIFDGRLSEAEQLAEHAKALGERAGAFNAVTNHTAQLLAIRREQGRLNELAEVITAFASETLESDSTEATELAWVCLHAQVRAADGDRVEATRALDALVACLERVRRDDFWLTTLTLAAEAAVEARHDQLTSLVYDMLLPYEGRCVVLGGGVVCMGPVDRVLALLAASTGSTRRAATHFEAARRQSDQMGGAAVRTRLAREYEAFVASGGDGTS